MITKKQFLKLLFFICLIGFVLLGYYSTEIFAWFTTPRNHLALMYGLLFLFSFPAFYYRKELKGVRECYREARDELREERERNYELTLQLNELRKKSKKNNGS